MVLTQKTVVWLNGAEWKAYGKLVYKMEARITQWKKNSLFNKWC